EWDEDDFGSVTAERRWGEVIGADRLVGKDESFTTRSYAHEEADWLLGRLATEEVTDASGARVAMTRRYYDGLSLGHVRRGDVTREEHWIGPAADAFELVRTTSYDPDGNPIEETDARGGGRIYTWRAEDRTFLASETIKLGGSITWREEATTD